MPRPNRVIEAGSGTADTLPSTVRPGAPLGAVDDAPWLSVIRRVPAVVVAP
jgi:hypothetical protein